MKASIVIFSILLSVVLTSAKHEFYVSIIELKVQKDTLQVAIKIFTDDLEEAIASETGEKVFLDNTTDMVASFSKIKTYCASQVSFSSSSKPYELKWIGHEYEDDVTWIYAYAIIDPTSKLLLARNTILVEHHSDQQNMIRLVSGSREESKLCSRSNPEARFSLFVE